jgi:hypothetical protein
MPYALTLHHEGVWGPGGNAPRVIDLGTRWRWAMSVTISRYARSRRVPGATWWGLLVLQPPGWTPVEMIRGPGRCNQWLYWLAFVLQYSLCLLAVSKVSWTRPAEVSSVLTIWISRWWEPISNLHSAFPITLEWRAGTVQNAIRISTSVRNLLRNRWSGTQRTNSQHFAIHSLSLSSPISFCPPSSVRSCAVSAQCSFSSQTAQCPLTCE